MKILSYSPAHRQFREELRAFCRTYILPFVDQWERDHQVPKSVWRQMGRNGFLCTAVSSEYGGRSGDFLYSVIALEEISLTNHYGLDAFLHSDIVVPYIAAYGTPEQKRRYLPGCVSGDIVTAIAMTEPDTGSDLASIATTAVEEKDAVVLNGAKTFISNGVICDLVVVAARDPMVENPYQAISLYLVEDGTMDSKKGRPWKNSGSAARTPTNSILQSAAFRPPTGWGEKGSDSRC